MKYATLTELAYKSMLLRLISLACEPGKPEPPVIILATGKTITLTNIEYDSSGRSDALIGTMLTYDPDTNAKIKMQFRILRGSVEFNEVTQIPATNWK